MGSNKRMDLTKRDPCLVGGPALARQRRAIFVESRFAGYAQGRRILNDRLHSRPWV